MEFGSGVLDAEAPVDAGLSFVSFQFQGVNLLAEGFLVRETLPEATAGEDAELDFRHIESTAVLGSVVKLQPLGDAPRLRRRERLVQRRLAMGIQIVQNHSNHRDIRIGLVHQPAHLMGKVLSGAPLCYRHMPPPGHGFAGQKQVAGALPPVLVVLTSGLSGCRWDGWPGVGQHLGGCLIEADHWPLGVIGFCIEIQDILHVGHEVGAHLGNAPLLLLPRLEDVFFRCSRTVSWDRDGTYNDISLQTDLPESE